MTNLAIISPLLIILKKRKYRELLYVDGLKWVGASQGCRHTPQKFKSWSKWNWYLLKVGQNGTDICLKLKVKSR
jgi:hypothetical protein